jgi:hypothetical protein
VGPALALVRAGKALVDEHYQLAYGFPNKLAEGVFKRAGYTGARHDRALRRCRCGARPSSIASTRRR